jgi:cyclomaltodextrinase / maltogenic alpha-amylase / neopullulanase
MITMLKHWLDPATFDLDGFRCDVAYMVPTSFWEEARAELSKVKPNLIMLAEASKPELLLNAFDLDYSWPLHATLNRVLLEGAPANELQLSWESSQHEFPQHSLHMRFADNHDEARAVARFGIKGALAASAMMFCLDGVPLLYNGMEAGDATESGDPALFEKMPVFWHPKDRPPLRKIYHDLIQLRRKNAAFRNDRVIWLANSEPKDLVTFMRLDQKDEFVVAVNFSNRPLIGWVEVMNEKEFKPVSIEGMPPTTSTNCFPLFRLGGYDWRIFHRQIEQ